MMKKIVVLLLSFIALNFALIILSGCFKKCTKYLCGYYNYASLIAVNNADSIRKMPDSGGVPAKAFLLLLTLSDTAYTCMNRSFPSGVTAAYAGCRDATRLLPVDSVLLVSNHNFDANHPAGANLKDLFSTPDSTGYRYLNTGHNSFYLLHMPADSGTHTFTIQLFMHDSAGVKTLSAASQPVKLLL